MAGYYLYRVLQGLETMTEIVDLVDLELYLLFETHDLIDYPVVTFLEMHHQLSLLSLILVHSKLFFLL